MNVPLTDTLNGGSNFWHSVAVMVKKNASIVLIYGIIIVIAITASIMSPAFRSAPNVFNILRQSIIIGLIAIGQSMVVLTGGMDFTVGMVARTTALTIATIFSLTNSSGELIIPLILLGILIGLVLGFINGVLVTYTHANPFVITFGIASILRGIDLAISQTPIRGIPAPYMKIYDATIGILPVNIIIMGLVWVVVWLFTTRTRPGRALFAVGGSERVAQLSAIRINRTLVMAYVISGACAALAGLFLLSRNGVGDPSAAEGMEFQSVVAVALGGISLYGGKGSMVGTLGGVLLIAMIWNVFNFLHVDIYYQQLLLGLVVLFAVAAYKSPRSL